MGAPVPDRVGRPADSLAGHRDIGSHGRGGGVGGDVANALDPIRAFPGGDAQGLSIRSGGAHRGGDALAGHRNSHCHGGGRGICQDVPCTGYDVVAGTGVDPCSPGQGDGAAVPHRVTGHRHSLARDRHADGIRFRVRSRRDRSGTGDQVVAFPGVDADGIGRCGGGGNRGAQSFAGNRYAHRGGRGLGADRDRALVPDIVVDGPRFDASRCGRRLCAAVPDLVQRRCHALARDVRVHRHRGGRGGGGDVAAVPELRRGFPGVDADGFGRGRGRADRGGKALAHDGHARRDGSGGGVRRNAARVDHEVAAGAGVDALGVGGGFHPAVPHVVARACHPLAGDVDADGVGIGIGGGGDGSAVVDPVVACARVDAHGGGRSGGGADAYAYPFARDGYVHRRSDGRGARRDGCFVLDVVIAALRADPRGIGRGGRSAVPDRVDACGQSFSGNRNAHPGRDGRGIGGDRPGVVDPVRALSGVDARGAGGGLGGGDCRGNSLRSGDGHAQRGGYGRGADVQGSAVGDGLVALPAVDALGGGCGAVARVEGGRVQGPASGCTLPGHRDAGRDPRGVGVHRDRAAVGDQVIALAAVDAGGLGGGLVLGIGQRDPEPRALAGHDVHSHGCGDGQGIRRDVQGALIDDDVVSGSAGQALGRGLRGGRDGGQRPLHAESLGAGPLIGEGDRGAQRFRLGAHRDGSAVADLVFSLPRVDPHGIRGGGRVRLDHGPVHDQALLCLGDHRSRQSDPGVAAVSRHGDIAAADDGVVARCPEDAGGIGGGGRPYVDQRSLHVDEVLRLGLVLDRDVRRDSQGFRHCVHRNVAAVQDPVVAFAALDAGGSRFRLGQGIHPGHGNRDVVDRALKADGSGDVQRARAGVDVQVALVADQFIPFASLDPRGLRVRFRPGVDKGESRERAWEGQLHQGQAQAEAATPGSRRGIRDDAALVGDFVVAHTSVDAGGLRAHGNIGAGQVLQAGDLSIEKSLGQSLGSDFDADAGGFRGGFGDDAAGADDAVVLAAAGNARGFRLDRSGAVARGVQPQEFQFRKGREVDQAHAEVTHQDFGRGFRRERTRVEDGVHALAAGDPHRLGGGGRAEIAGGDVDGAELPAPGLGVCRRAGRERAGVQDRVVSRTAVDSNCRGLSVEVCRGFSDVEQIQLNGN